MFDGFDRLEEGEPEIITCMSNLGRDGFDQFEALEAAQGAFPRPEAEEPPHVRL